MRLGPAILIATAIFAFWAPPAFEVASVKLNHTGEAPVLTPDCKMALS
jgi:hypothetical protein